MNEIELMLTGQMEMSEFLRLLKSDSRIQQEVRDLVPADAVGNESHPIWKKYSFSTMEKCGFDLYRLLLHLHKFDLSIPDNLNIWSSIGRFYEYLHPEVELTNTYHDAFDLYLSAVMDCFDGPEVRHWVLKVIQDACDQPTKKKRLEYAKSITDASRRLADMMTNILKLNRLENQQIYPNLTTFDLGEQLCESLLQYESTWERKNIEIETDIAESVHVSADAELLSLVWNNLFSNAFKFTEDGGKVTLVLTADEKYATVKVTDTGCGMSAEGGVHIFEKFYQGDTSHATQGNGLGLPLVKRVIDIMQGEIGVESAIGVGTTFTVKIRRSEYGLEETR